MRTSRRVRVVLYTVALVGFAMSASAQNVPNAEFSAGWRLLTLPNAFGEESQTMPLGWYADVAGNLNRVFGVVGEVAGNYKSFTENETQFGATVRVDADINVHTFLGGVRVSARQVPAFTPYAQALFGLARAAGHIKGQATIAGRTIDVIDEDESDSDVAFDAGGGVNFNVSDALAVRVGASYLRVGGSDGGNAFRFGVGVVYPF